MDSDSDAQGTADFMCLLAKLLRQQNLPLVLHTLSVVHLPVNCTLAFADCQVHAPVTMPKQFQDTAVTCFQCCCMSAAT